MLSSKFDVWRTTTTATPTLLKGQSRATTTPSTNGGTRLTHWARPKRKLKIVSLQKHFHPNQPPVVVDYMLLPPQCNIKAPTVPHLCGGVGGSHSQHSLLPPPPLSPSPLPAPPPSISSQSKSFLLKGIVPPPPSLPSRKKSQGSKQDPSNSSRQQQHNND